MFKKSGTYWTQVRVDGKKKNIRLGKNKKKAEKLEREIRAYRKRCKEEESNPLDAEPITVKEMLEKYKLNHVRHAYKKSGQDNYRYFCNVLNRLLGHRKLSELTPEVINRTIAERRGEEVSEGKLVNSGTVRREFDTLRAALRKGREWGFLHHSPFETVRLPQASPKRVRFQKPEEFQKLLDAYLAGPPYLFVMGVTASFSGLRRGNVRSLKWRYFDWDAQTIYLPETKNGEPQVVHMTTWLCRVLRAWWDRRDPENEWVFPNPTTGRPYSGGHITRTHRKICRDNGIEDFRWHDHRHNFGSWLAQRDVPLSIIGPLLNHKDLKMTQRYAHLAPEQKRKAIGTLEDVLPMSYQERASNG